MTRSAYARALGFEDDIVWVADEAACARKAKRKKKKKKRKKKIGIEGSLAIGEAHGDEQDGVEESEDVCDVDEMSFVDGDSDGGDSDG